MGKKRKSLLDKVKDLVSSPEEIKETSMVEPVEEDVLANEEALAELSDGKGEDDELLEPEAEGEENGN